MAVVTVSTKYQVVIPEEVRRELKIRPGQKLEVVRRDNVVYLIPIRDVREFRGALPGIDTEVPRDPDRV